MKVRFELEAGALIRRQIRRALKSFEERLIFDYPDAKVSVEEDRGFLNSAFYVKISAKDEAHQQVKDFTDYLERIANERGG